MATPKNDKLNELYRKTTVKIAIVSAVLLILTGLLTVAGKYSQAFVMGVYRPFSRFVMHVFAYATAFVPFSIAEILLYALILLATVLIFRLGYVLITGRRRLSYLTRFLANTLLLCSSALFAFYLLWGVNYSAEPLVKTLGYPERTYTAQELHKMNLHLVDRVNYYAQRLERGDDRTVTLLANAVAKDFSGYTGRREVSAKYVIASVPMSYLMITGIFVPFTGEANVNKNDLPSSLPFSMAHEMSHRYGIAREDEANFFAFYILKDSIDPALAYSAYFSALVYCQNALYDADYELFLDVRDKYGDFVNTDLDENRQHWTQYEGDIAAVSSAVNDAYLTAQGQEDGVESYGRMVDLMLAWYYSR